MSSSARLRLRAFCASKPLDPTRAAVSLGVASSPSGLGSCLYVKLRLTDWVPGKLTETKRYSHSMSENGSGLFIDCEFRRLNNEGADAPFSYIGAEILCSSTKLGVPKMTLHTSHTFYYTPSYVVVRSE